MGKTLIEKIIESHSDHPVTPGDIVDIRIDARVARDFGGANVVKNIREHGLSVDDPKKTYFTFDCNPGGSDQKYAQNQHLCRLFARENDVRIYDVDAGIGTHIAIERGITGPGETFVSTDSHANIMGAIGAFGQGMGDQDIAAAWANGKVWFKVPATIKLLLKGKPDKYATAKDITLAILRATGANGLLGYAAEVYGDMVEQLDLAERITIASMNTEMGGIILFFPPNEAVIRFCSTAKGQQVRPVYADPDASYAGVLEVDIDGLEPLCSKPGHPEDILPVKELSHIKIDSAFIGSCTNGRYEDMAAAAKILKDRRVAPGVVLKIVPATDSVWRQCLNDGIIGIFKQAGALLGNAGCAGCANGQIGQNGPGEVTVSTGNRNYSGKQGKGDVYLCSPATVAASAVAGRITSEDHIPSKPVLFRTTEKSQHRSVEHVEKKVKSEIIEGSVWVIPKDNIDTDMIFHNRYLAITDLAQMGQYTFDNLPGWEDFAKKALAGDIVVTGKNFGAGSSRQQAVDCFKSLGISLIIAQSYGAIYERNAINAGMPILVSDLIEKNVANGQKIRVNLKTGEIKNLTTDETVQGQPFFDVQLKIYQRGGLL